MTQKRGQAHHGDRTITQTIRLTEPFHQHDRQPAFEGVEQERHDGRRLGPRAQYIGGAGVLTAKSARIVQAHDTAHNDGKRERAHQICSNGGQQGIESSEGIQNQFS